MVQDFLTMCRKIYVPIHGEEVVREVFSPLTEDKLKKLVKIYRDCPAFSWQNIEIYLKNDYPIIIKYSVANLGEVKFCLAPKNSD